MRRLTILVVLGLGLAVGAEAGPKTAKPVNTSKPTITKMQAPKSGAPKGATIKSSAPKVSTVKTTGAQTKGSAFKSTGGQAKGSSVKAKGAQAKVSTGKQKGTQATLSTGKSGESPKSDTKFAKTDAKAPTRTSTAPIDFSSTSLGQKLQKNTALRSKIEAKLQAAGYTGSVYEAAYGFKNLGQFNAATNQVQNQGYSFNLLKVLMTGTYVDPQTHVVYRANQLPDGTVNLVRAGLATEPASTQSLGQAKQTIAAGAEMPSIERTQTNATSTTNRPPR